MEQNNDVYTNEDATEVSYICPYCGQEIGADEVLFWEKGKEIQDDIRRTFRKDHGFVTDKRKYERIYYKVTDDNILDRDENGFPRRIEDSIRNAYTPEELTRNKKDDFDDEEDEDDDEDMGSPFGSRKSSSGSGNLDKIHIIPQRACPHCHCELPSKFGALKTYHVALFGGKASGKTAYLINLFQRLSICLTEANLGSAVLENESLQFMNELTEEYKESKNTNATPVDGGLMPIVIRYSYQKKECFIVMYDIAGEGTANDAYMANNQGIANCETLLLMIDPNMFCDGVYYKQMYANNAEDDLDAAYEDHDCCKDSVDTFLQQAGQLCAEYAQNIRNIICVVTKMDMLLSYESTSFSAGKIEVVQDIGTKHRDFVNIPIIDQVSAEIDRFLMNKYHVRLAEKLQYAFGGDKKVSIRLLGVSTSTRNSSAGSNAIGFRQDFGANAVKHRIAEPFFLMLYWMGLVPAKLKDGSVMQAGKLISAPPQKVGFFARLFGKGKKK